MKNIYTLAVKRLLPLAVFILVQVKAWAVDTTTATTLDKAPNIFSQPWIWIGVTAVIMIKLLGPLSESTKDVIIIRKKAPRK